MLPSHRSSHIRLLSQCLVVASGAILLFPCDLRAHEPGDAAGHSHDDFVVDWHFWPQYTLGQNAKNQIGPAIPPPAPLADVLRQEPLPLVFQGQRPTERRLNLIEVDELPRDAITVEMWICDHVNQPVGVLMAARGRDAADLGGLAFGYFNGQVFFGLQTSRRPDITRLQTELPGRRAFKRYWRHLVATYDGASMQLYQNGQPLAATSDAAGEVEYPEDGTFEIAAYMDSEPYMEIANLLHAVRIHNRALTPAGIQARFDELCDYVERGILYPGLFHFNAGPYLNFATQSSINMLWETDRPAEATVRWGRSAQLDRSKSIETPQLSQETTLSGLEPSSPYFYQVTATDQDGQSIDSGVLTFQTAVRPGEPFKFGLIGDAEFFMLESNREDEFAPGSRQYQWLDEQLAESTAKWKFACHHHAPFTSEENDYGDAWQGESTRGDVAIRRIVPVYEKHGVDVVMFGHLHLYERTLPIREGQIDYEHGVMYLLAGGAGGNLEDFAPTPAAFSAKTYRGHHSCTMQIAGDTLTMRMHDLAGALRDEHVIRKKSADKTSAAATR